MALQAYGWPLSTVQFFKYLGWVLTASDDDWPAVFSNFKKYRRNWSGMCSILVREGAYARTCGTFYKVVVQAILLFSS